MGRKGGKRSFRNQNADSADGGDEDMLIRRGASVKAIKTWDDVEQESADEFDSSRDKVLLDYDRKKARKDGGLSDNESDEEVFRVNMADSSSSDIGEDEDGKGEFYSDTEADDQDDQDDEEGAWGKHKYNYYDADDIGEDTDDDEAAAQEEEEEAMRLQKKQLETLDEDDFIDEFSTQLGVSSAKDDKSFSRLVGSVDDGHTQIDLEKISFGADSSSGAFDMSEAKKQALEKLSDHEKIKVIQSESPELFSLVDDFSVLWERAQNDVLPLLTKASSQGVSADDHPALAFYLAQYQVIMSYLNNISVYLVMKSSTAAERGGVELCDHPVISYIVEFRRRLEMMEALQKRLAPLLSMFEEELNSETLENTETATIQPSERSEVEDTTPATLKTTKPKKSKKTKKSATAAAFLDNPTTTAGVDSYAELRAMLKKERLASKPKKLSKQKRSTGAVWESLEDDGGFGDQEQLAEEDADDKERAIRRLRHHAKRIVQSQSKRENRDKLSGDVDIPYKDRRNAADRLRLDDSATEAARARAEQYGDDLDSDVGEMSNSDSTDDEYTRLEKATRLRKDKAAAEKEERKQSHWKEMVAANEEAEAEAKGDIKRNINYQILKNKGLQPKRTKEQRNPRVKRRMRYEQAKKKLGSTVAQVRSLQGNYGGEATGIKANLSRSTRFK